ncbi:hypothetical protein FHS15_004771 [Paenibacillus castaneae]|uniref:copper amine oxidase N-terminal domain-containing protein n=1 Tax=Paenibacillus castaneae TaxID=474957 RepID=UPI000C9AE0DD|nr:copper amine oxidase N-terminal domain-containing protein [Paenibacillus castaneae]NIK79610.1 hypothetical protein [Paenibacillus castaneae]
MKRFSLIFICFLLLGALVPFTAAAAAKSNIKVNLGGSIIPFEVSPQLENGRVLVPVRFVSDALYQKTEWNNQTKVVKISGPKNKIELTVGSKTAYLNGVKHTLDVPAKMINGRVFVPLRFVSQIAEGDVSWDEKTQTVYIDSLYQNVKLSSGELISLQWQTGDLYYADSSKSYRKLTNLELKRPGGGNLSADLTPEGNILVSVSNDYGEPMVNRTEYSLYLYNKQIKKQTTAHYYYRTQNNVRMYKNNVVMTDGQKAYVIDDKTGEIANAYDLEGLGGAKGDYFVEGIGDHYLLIRPANPLALLTLIYTATNEKILLYKELLNAAEQDYAERDDIQRGDQLEFIKEDKNILYFRNNSMHGKDDKIYEYALSK